MKARVIGVSAWQGTPTGGTLDVEVHGRYVDSSGNATVSHYTAVLDLYNRKWVDPRTREDLWLIVQGPDDPPAPYATFYEVLSYESGDPGNVNTFSMQLVEAPPEVVSRDVRTRFRRRLISDDLDGTIFDYASAGPLTFPPGFGDAPLTMLAAKQLLEQQGRGASPWALVEHFTRSVADVTAEGYVTGTPGAVSVVPLPYGALGALQIETPEGDQATVDVVFPHRFPPLGEFEVRLGVMQTDTAVEAGLRFLLTAAAADGSELAVAFSLHEVWAHNALPVSWAPIPVGAWETVRVRLTPEGATVTGTDGVSVTLPFPLLWFRNAEPWTVTVLVDASAVPGGQATGFVDALAWRPLESGSFDVEVLPSGPYWATLNAYAQLDQGDGTTIVSLEIPPDITVTAYASGMRVAVGEDVIALEQYGGVPGSLGEVPVWYWSSTRQDVTQPPGKYAFIVRLPNEALPSLLWFELEHTPY